MDVPSAVWVFYKITASPTDTGRQGWELRAIAQMKGGACALSQRMYVRQYLYQGTVHYYYKCKSTVQNVSATCISFPEV